MTCSLATRISGRFSELLGTSSPSAPGFAIYTTELVKFSGIVFEGREACLIFQSLDEPIEADGNERADERPNP